VVVRRHDLRHDPPPSAQTIAANLLGPLLIEWAGRLASVPRRPDVVIASGMLTHETEAVAAAFAAAGMSAGERRARGEWAALKLVHVVGNSGRDRREAGRD
jgi:ribosomal protein L11 methylase PrmA